MVARTSHIPHLVAAALVSSVGREGVKDIRDFCGPGFRDTTRVAEGSPDVWMDIIKTNREGVRRELQAFEKRIHEITALLDSGQFKEIQDFLERSETEARRTVQAGTEMTEFAVVHPCSAISGVVRVPGDKSISHRVAMLSAIASGESAIEGFLRSEDCLNTLKAVEALGARVSIAPDAIKVIGTGGVFHQPDCALDLGNSGTGIRLLTGLLAGQPGTVELTGDTSLRSRPMAESRNRWSAWALKSSFSAHGDVRQFA